MKALNIAVDCIVKEVQPEWRLVGKIHQKEGGKSDGRI
jgi:hypothetical protein